jgi:hypothetical protein
MKRVNLLNITFITEEDAERQVNRAAPVTLEVNTTLVGAATVEQMFGNDL